MGDSTPAAPAKAELRHSIRESRRRRLAASDHATSADAFGLADRVMELREIRAACAHGRAIACYASRADEPPTGQLRDRLLEAGAVVLLPRIDAEELRWIPVTSDTTWSVNRWGITEPQGSVFPHAPELWIIPALAIDADGYRLGQGGGYYDRALAHVVDDVPIIGVVFDDEVLERVPREEHDTCVDVVVTPERTIVIGLND